MGEITDMDIEFCTYCGKVLSEHERPGPECEICEYTDDDEFDEFGDWEDDLDE